MVSIDISDEHGEIDFTEKNVFRSVAIYESYSSSKSNSLASSKSKSKPK